MIIKTLLSGCFIAIFAAGCFSTPASISNNGNSNIKTAVIKTVVIGKGGSTGKPAPAMPGENVPAIKVNTVGYVKNWKKIVVFNFEPTEAVVKNASGKVVLTIAKDKIVSKGLDAASQDSVWQVDISELQESGTFIIHSNNQQSDPFVIDNNVYAKSILAGLKSFYFQRTRCALEKPYAVWEGDAYTRKTASHVHKDVGWDQEDYPAKKRKWAVKAGWHDAGNFDMYIPSTGPTAQTLLLAYQWAPSQFNDSDLVIPESGNGIPDILDETKWGLDWILSMQDEDGSFRAREAVLEWSPEGPADEDKTERWISGVSSSATAKAISVLAIASRVYAPFNKEYAVTCEASAKKAWEFLKKHPEHIRPNQGASKQPLWDDEPDCTDIGARFAAASEMWLNYRDESALDSVKQLMEKDEAKDPIEIIKGAWANISRFGLGAMALDEKTPVELREEFKKRILAGADILVEQSTQQDGYLCTSTVKDYYWGHNSNLMEKVYVLALAAKLAPDNPLYMETAREQWHWVLGRNPIGFSMVTRVGKGPTRLYHMEWGNNEPPPPGFLVGGPNYGNSGYLSPGAPAKAILWENPEPLRSGVKAHSLWHWKQTDLWDSGFIPEDEWSEGWWATTESDILYSSNFVLAGVVIQ